MGWITAVSLALPQAAAEYVVTAQVGWTLRQMTRDAVHFIARNPEQSALIGVTIVVAIVAWIRFAEH